MAGALPADAARVHERALDMNEHQRKYDALARKLGWSLLIRLVPVPLERIRAVLDAGDEHLNSIPLKLWDGAALDQRRDAPWTVECPAYGCKHLNPEHTGVGEGSDWPYSRLRETARSMPWSADPNLSLAERVCALKHVARVEALKLP